MERGGEKKEKAGVLWYTPECVYAVLLFIPDWISQQDGGEKDVCVSV